MNDFRAADPKFSATLKNVQFQDKKSLSKKKTKKDSILLPSQENDLQK